MTWAGLACSQRVEQGLRGNAVVDDEGKVAADDRQLRETAWPIGTRPCSSDVQVDFEHDRRFRKLEVPHQPGVQLAEPADGFAVHDDPRA